MTRPMYLGSKLRPIIDLWPKVRDILGIRGIHVVSFVEGTIEQLQVTLYLDDEDTGLWRPRPFDDGVQRMIQDMGASDLAISFFNQDPEDAADRENWGKFRITEGDFDAIIEKATKVAGAEPPSTERPESDTQYLNPDHPHYAAKLAAAVAAWQTVTKNRKLLQARRRKRRWSDGFVKMLPSMGS